ncbi:trimethyllysine dioxygenase, mitochondrial-like [Zerene cesonia]|uniref:trimethyllysine dioxygenase, mitochondrial-like n=1 Tax=Zerene cesonia TaxID=33412 RepID=UPI0018E4E26C|nr:trimethyllysine dioxygenase, mitochondrial-like [Zerene cesonia]
MRGIKGVERKGTTLNVQFVDGESITFEDCWLRDNCRCSTCFNASTNQRAFHILDLPEVSFQDVKCNKSGLTVIWNDNHISTYTPDFLIQFHNKIWNNDRRMTPKLWRGEVPEVARIPVHTFINSTDGAKLIFQSLLDYGLAFVEQVEPTLEATEVVCKALGGIQNTLFGGMWTISPEPGVNDTAYMNIALKQHTDLSSFTEPAGLQVFHCLQHDGNGGESVVSDGFYAANKLKEEHPEDFEFLTRYNVEAEYMFNGHSYRYAAPAIELDRFGDLKAIRFNSFDRAPIAFDKPEECRAYYRSMKNFAKYIEDPACQWQFKLKPGTILAFDNFRVLHGRTGFTGMRVIGGTYVARTDWLDKARALELIK